MAKIANKMTVKPKNSFKKDKLAAEAVEAQKVTVNIGSMVRSKTKGKERTSFDKYDSRGRYWRVFVNANDELSIIYNYKGKFEVSVSLHDSLEDIERKCQKKHARILEDLRQRIVNR